MRGQDELLNPSSIGLDSGSMVKDAEIQTPESIARTLATAKARRRRVRWIWLVILLGLAGAGAWYGLSLRRQPETITYVTEPARQSPLFALDDAAEAHRFMETKRARGKVVLEVQR